MILVIVFVIISSIGVVVIDIIEDRYMLENYVENSIDTQQVLLASNSISKAITKLLDSDDKTVDYLGELWAENISYSFENVKIEIQIIDQERYLNPNRLIEGKKINEKFLQIFKKLFEILEIDKQVIYNMIDWIDSDSFSNGGKEYYGLYTAKNSKIDTLEELFLIDGINPQVFNGNVSGGKFIPGLRSVLSPYTNGKVNINTAPIWVIMALDPEIDNTLAYKIIHHRKEKPFKKVDDLVLVSGFNSDILYRIKPLVDVKSENFIAQINISIGDRKYNLVILIKRKGKTKIVWKKLY